MHFFIKRRRIFNISVKNQLAFANHQAPLAEILRLRRRMGDKEEGHTAVQNLRDPSASLSAEILVAHAEGLVHNNDIRADIGIDGEAQLGFHTAGIGADGHIDIAAQLRKSHNVRLHLLQLLPADAQQLAAEIDILPAGKPESKQRY